MIAICWLQYRSSPLYVISSQKLTKSCSQKLFQTPDLSLLCIVSTKISWSQKKLASFWSLVWLGKVFGVGSLKLDQRREILSGNKKSKRRLCNSLFLSYWHKKRPDSSSFVRYLILILAQYQTNFLCEKSSSSYFECGLIGFVVGKARKKEEFDIFEGICEFLTV